MIGPGVQTSGQIIRRAGQEVDMKITGTLPAPIRESPTGRARAAVQSRSDTVARQVLLTSGARFIEETREAASGLAKVRADEVARARADVMSGAILDDAELDAAVDAILAGL
jgi:hypothetical protein